MKIYMVSLFHRATIKKPRKNLKRAGTTVSIELLQKAAFWEQHEYSERY